MQTNTKNRLNRFLSSLYTLFVVIFISLVLLGTVRGIKGNPSEKTLNTNEFKEAGPMELSPERGRFALTYSLVENKSFYFSVPIARFVLPDLGYKDGNYVSLFAPGVSFLAIPGYMIGKYFDVSQVGTFLTSSFFALLNSLLIIKIAERLGISKLAGIIGALTFIFATPAFSYGVNLYQHHFSTFLILASAYLLISFNGFWSTFTVWLLAAAGIPIDYPNLFLMFPIGILAILKNIKALRDEKNLKITLRYQGILAFIAVILPLSFFLWFNQKSYGNPLQFSGTVPGVKAINADGKPDVPAGVDPTDIEKFVNPETQDKSAINFFNTRNISNGLYIHILSPDRGIIVFTPVILTGILGFIYLSRRKKIANELFVGVFFINLILYSMWGDPWGGWGFGSRYLIPGYAILAIGVSAFLQKYICESVGIRKFSATAFFLITFSYSLFVNTVGALTTSAIPPKIQIEALEAITGKNESYTFTRGFLLLDDNHSKSFIFGEFLKNQLSAWQYFYIVYIVILVFTGMNLIYLITISPGASANQNNMDSRLEDEK